METYIPQPKNKTKSNITIEYMRGTLGRKRSEKHVNHVY
jgi:hypothetical protein